MYMEVARGLLQAVGEAVHVFEQQGAHRVPAFHQAAHHLLHMAAGGRLDAPHEEPSRMIHGYGRVRLHTISNVSPPFFPSSLFLSSSISPYCSDFLPLSNFKIHSHLRFYFLVVFYSLGAGLHFLNYFLKRLP